MTVRRVSSSLAAASLAAGVVSAMAVPAPPAAPLEANPCAEVKNCKPVAGPWVAVPATGEANFLLECPKRAGTIGGTDALVSSNDVRVVWEGNTGAPVRPGTTTVFFAFFRATSAHGRVGLFQPYIGCIPSPKNRRSTVLARITRPGLYLDRWQTPVNVKAGTNQTASRGCGKGERLLSGWQAVAFGSPEAPDPALASKVHVALTIAKGKVVASIKTDAGLPALAQAEVQVGAVCSK